MTTGAIMIKVEKKYKKKYRNTENIKWYNI